MGAARPTPWCPTDTTIREFYGLTGRDRTISDPGGHAGALLSHDSFRALFDLVERDMYVGIAALAVYLDLSQFAIEGRLAEAFGSLEKSWRTVLANRSPVSSPGPALVDACYRWSFIRSEIEPMLAAEKRRAALRRVDLRTRKASRDVSSDHSVFRVGCGIARQRYVLDASGCIVGALGQGNVTANMFIGTLNGDGRITKLDPLDALGHAWANPEARAAWDDALRDAVEAGVQHIRARLNEAASASERICPSAHQSAKPPTP